MYDLVVIGAGPGGYVAAIRAAQGGAKVALIEQDEVGGVCLNRGCIPTKTLLHSAGLYQSIKKAAEFGVTVSTPTVDFARMISRKEQVVKTLVGGIQWLLKKNKVQLIKGKAQLESAKEIRVNEEIIKSENLIIAVGSSPALLPIPGADDPAVITSDEALSLDRLPASLAIIGGGVIGVEMAFLFQSLGCAVTIIELMDRLVPMFDAEVSKTLTEILVKNGITVYTNARVEAIEEGVISYRYNGNLEHLAPEKILMAVGRRSNGLSLDLDKVGIKHEKGVIATDNRLRTSVPNIYAIGDVNGKYMLAHVASAEGIVAVENILGRSCEMSYEAVPQCIYTQPEVAAVGLTQEEAEKEGYRIKVSKIPLLANGKALAVGETKGFIKMIADLDTEQILGAHIIAPSATDMIAQVCQMIALKNPAGELAKVIYPHPTVSEIIAEATHGIVDRPIHI